MCQRLDDPTNGNKLWNKTCIGPLNLGNNPVPTQDCSIIRKKPRYARVKDQLARCLQDTPC